MYKSLLSAEELNALLSPEQVSELAAADRQTGELPAHSIEVYHTRIQQLELNIYNLLQRVELLESQLSSLGGGLPETAAAAAVEERANLAAEQAQPVQVTPKQESDAPIVLSRVETYRQKPKKSKSLFR